MEFSISDHCAGVRVSRLHYQNLLDLLNNAKYIMKTHLIRSRRFWNSQNFLGPEDSEIPRIFWDSQNLLDLLNKAKYIMKTHLIFLHYDFMKFISWHFLFYAKNAVCIMFPILFNHVPCSFYCSIFSLLFTRKTKDQ